MYVLIVEAERPDGDRCIDEVLGPMTLDAVSFRFGIRLAELITAGELVAPTVTVAALVDWRQRDRPTRVINVVDSL
jgi:hypothetical protein